MRNEQQKKEIISVDKYLHEIEKIKLIDAEEAVELAKKIKMGDKNALETLIKANLRLVVSVAKQYQNQGLSLPDLINKGNLGLIKAAKRYDETCGLKFISYGVWWIRQSILQALAEKTRIVRLPENKIGSITSINKTSSRLEQEYQREPTADEVAFLLETSSEIVEDALKVSSFHISMDAPTLDEEWNSLYDVLLNEDSLCPDKGLMNVSLCKEIERTLSTLSEREADVIRYYFGLSGHRQHTIEEIGIEFGLTRDRVLQIKEKSMKKIRNNYRKRILKNFYK